MTERHDTLRLAPHVEWREVEGEIVALDVERSLCLAANRSAALLWRALSGGATAERLAELLVEAFAVGHDTAAHDVEAFLDRLEEGGYLTRSGP